jgi:hypothetical protein
MTEKVGMKTRGRCRICRRWFRRDARPGGRQHVCGAAACQRERHRQACQVWRRKNRFYDRHDRLVRRLVRVAVARPAAGDPLAAIDWEAARTVVGLDVAVVVEESGKVLTQWTRDAIFAQVLESTRQSGPIRSVVARDARSPHLSDSEATTACVSPGLARDAMASRSDAPYVTGRLERSRGP